MINPIRLCNDLFNDEKLSDSNLRSFTEDHLLRLSNNNPGSIYTALISDTTTKYTAYYGKMNNQALQESVQENLTNTMNEKKAAVEEQIRSFHGLAIFKYGDDSGQYQQLYPLGLDEYMKAKIGDVTILYNRLNTNVATFFTVGFPTEVAAFNTAVQDFITARSAQENAFSLVDNLITGKNTDRKALTAQLTFNFLTIAANNIDKPDQFDDYYDPRYLPIEGGSGSTTIHLSADELKNVLDASANIHANTPIRLTNTGTTQLIAGFATAANQKPDDDIAITLNPNETITKTAAQMGYVNGTVVFLNILNNNATTPGQAELKAGA